MKCPECEADVTGLRIDAPCPECGVPLDRQKAIDQLRERITIPTPTVTAGENLEDGSHRTTVQKGTKFKSVHEVDADGTHHQSYEGQTVRGEDNVLQVCHALRPKLREYGFQVDRFEKPKGLETGVDAVAKLPDGTYLEVQVTGVLPEHVHEQLGRLNKAAADSSPEELARQLSEAVQRKVKKNTSRKGVHLVLDAFRQPAHAEPSVVQALSEPEHEIVRTSGYEAVWLVGTGPDIHRIDQ